MSDELVEEMIRRLVLAVERISVDIEILKEAVLNERDEVDLWSPEDYGRSDSDD